MMKRDYKHQRPNQVVDTRDWQFDDQTYAEGAREKSTVLAPATPPFDFLMPEHRYLSKASNHRAPIQFWMEVVAYRFGCLCGIPVPPTFVSLNADGECRALIEWFYKEHRAAKESYRPGYSLLLETDPMMDKEKGIRHSYDTLYATIDKIQKECDSLEKTVHEYWLYRLLKRILPATLFCYATKKLNNDVFRIDLEVDFLRIFTLDSLIGNTDRHHENWGILVNVGEIKRGNIVPIVSLSPAFDNGTSLGYNFSEEQIEQRLKDNAWFAHYAAKGRHHLRTEPGGKQFKHDELIALLLTRRPDMKPVVEEIISFEMTDLRTILGELTQFNVPIQFTPSRAEFIARLIEAKREALKIVLNRC